jgi:sarcosine oxidase subunit gamma
VPELALAPLTIASAWNVQGERAAGVARDRFGVALDATPGSVTTSGDVTALWLGPRSWLLVSGVPLADFAAARDALCAAGGALFDLSASRVGYAVRGRRAVDVLAAGCPLDLDADAFAPGRCAQSVFARVNALYCRAADGFVVMVPRSFARDVWHGLCEAGREYGYEVESAQAWRAPYGI